MLIQPKIALQFLLAFVLILSLSAGAENELHLVTYLGSDGSTSYRGASSEVFTAESIARSALAQLQRPLKVSQLPAMRALQQANAGYVDGDLWRLAGTEQQFDNLIAVREPLCYADIYFYTLLDRTQSNYWHSMILPKIILLPETQSLLPQLPETLIKQQPIQAASISQALRALLRGDGNMILLPEGLIEVIEQEQKGALPWVLKLHPSVAKLPAHLLLHKRHRDISEPLSLHIQASKDNFIQSNKLPDATAIECR